MALSMAVAVPCSSGHRRARHQYRVSTITALCSSRSSIIQAGSRQSNIGLEWRRSSIGSSVSRSSGSIAAALGSFTRTCLDSGICEEAAFGARDLGRGIGNGSRWFLMRHGRKVPKLNRPPDQRRALLRGLTTQLLRHGRIKTTRARAKAMRPHVEHMVTLAKGGSLHQRRQALGYIYDKQLVHALFAEVPDRYSDRNGGYTRVIRTMPRRGDNAPMAYIELV